MSKQVVLWRNKTAMSASTRYAPLSSGQIWATLESDGTHPWAAAGEFSNLEVTLGAAPGVGNSRTFAVRINGSDSALTVTISGAATTAQLTGTQVSIAQWDLVSLKATSTGTPTATSNVLVSCDFDGTTAGQQCYGLGSGQPIAATRTNRLFTGMEAGNWSATNASDIAAISGTVGGYGVRIVTTIATGTWTFVILKNGVVQDGSGGTVDTRLAFTSASSLSQQVTFSLSVTAGDLMQFQCQETVSATALDGVAFGVLFTATTPGEFMLGACASGNITLTDTLYGRVTGGNSLLPTSTTETDEQIKVGVTPFTLSQFRIELNAASTSFTFTLRQNAAATALAATISGVTSGSDLTDLVTCNPGDLLAVEVDPTGSPTTRVAGWSFAANADALIQGRAWGFVGTHAGMGFAE